MKKIFLGFVCGMFAVCANAVPDRIVPLKENGTGNAKIYINRNNVATCTDNGDIITWYITKWNEIKKLKNDEEVDSFPWSKYDAGLPDKIACSSDGKTVWIVNSYTEWFLPKGRLYKSDDNGAKFIMEQYQDQIAGIALSANGKIGYTITRPGNFMSKYENNRFTGFNYYFKKKTKDSKEEEIPVAISCSADGAKIWCVAFDENRNYVLLESNDYGKTFNNVFKIAGNPLTTNEELVSVFLSRDRSYGYVATNTHDYVTHGRIYKIYRENGEYKKSDNLFEADESRTIIKGMSPYGNDIYIAGFNSIP